MVSFPGKGLKGSGGGWKALWGIEERLMGISGGMVHLC